jgi:hypothetical protein
MIIFMGYEKIGYFISRRGLNFAYLEDIWNFYFLSNLSALLFFFEFIELRAKSKKL